VPARLHGTYTVRLKTDFGFKTDVKPVTIEIE
jgi:hypothetical protein